MCVHGGADLVCAGSKVLGHQFVGPYPRALVTLTLLLKCVDVVCESPKGMTSVQGLPSPELTHSI